MCNAIIRYNIAHYHFVLTLKCNQFALMLCSEYVSLSPSHLRLRNNLSKSTREHHSREKTYLSQTVCYSNPAVSHRRHVYLLENRKPNEI